MRERAYEEVGTNYRFFLAWRHASFAGMLVVLYGTAQLVIAAMKDRPSAAWLVPILASPSGVLFWVVDARTRDLYHSAIRAGKRLEGKGGGFFTELSEVTLPHGASPFSRLSQSAALNLLFWGSSVVMIATGLYLRWSIR